MKRLVILLLICKLGYAQVDTLSPKKYKRFFFSASGGFANAVNKFGSSTGSAKNGYNGKAEVMCLVHKNFGIICSYYNSINKAIIPSEDSLFPQSPPGTGGLQPHGSVINSYTYNTTSWYTNNVLLGAAVNFGVKRVKIRLKLAGGWQRVKSPTSQLNYTGTGWVGSPTNSNNYSGSDIQSVMTSTNFVFGAGIDIRVVLLKELGVIVSMDYLNSFAHFDGNHTLDFNSSNYSYSGVQISHPYTQQISLLLFNAGVCYAF